MKKIHRKPYRIKKKKLFFHHQFFWLVTLILIIFGGIFYLISFHSFFQVRAIEISGNQRVATEDLQNLLAQKINQRILFFPSRSIFLTNINQIEKEIFRNFLQVKEVDLRREFPDTLSLEIRERKPIAIFCEEANCFFVDQKGIIFEATTLQPNFVHLVCSALAKERDQEISLGKKIINEEQLGKILEVNVRLKNELKIWPKEFLVFSERRFNVKTSEGWQIYFNFQEDLNWQLTKLRAVLEKEIPPERRKDLEYIDVRFGNFAPYRYRTPER